MKKDIQLAVLSLVGFLSLLFAVPAMAATMPGPGMMDFGGPMIAGTVSSVTGGTMVISSSDSTSYSVDATSATIHKGPNTTIQISQVATGDFVIVQGTINGTNVVAKNIIDANFNHERQNALGDSNTNRTHRGLEEQDGLRPNTTMMFGRGFTGLVGTILDSSTFTINTHLPGKNDHATTTITVDTTSATVFTKGTTTASFADLSVGLPVGIEGVFATSTNTITATKVHIGLPPRPMKGLRGNANLRGDDWKHGSTTPPGWNNDEGKGTTTLYRDFGASVFDFFRGLAHFFGR